MLRVFVISDIHGKEDTLGHLAQKAKDIEAGIVVVCGDITHFGKPKGFVGKFVQAMPAQVIAVPGNCDPPGDVMGDLDRAGALCIHGNKAEFGGITFAGVGGAPVSGNGLPFEIPDGMLAALLESTMTKGCVLVTHAPGKGHLDSPTPGVSLGSEGIAEAVAKFHPVLHLSGHVHEARGIEQDEQGTIYVNPGPARDGHAALVTITDTNKVKAELL